MVIERNARGKRGVHMAAEDGADEIDANDDRYERMYRARSEPWGYASSATEALRYAWVVETARRLVPEPGAVLDIGCGLGQLTRRLIGYAREIHAIDVAPTAVERARDACARELEQRGDADTSIIMRVGTSAAIPCADACIDVVFYCDGIAEHGLAGAELEQVAADVRRVMAPGAIAVFTDYVGAERFDAYVDTVRGCSFDVVLVHHFGDRPWFQLRSWLKAVPPAAKRAVLASEHVARALAAVGRSLGPRGSKHIAVIARRAG